MLVFVFGLFMTTVSIYLFLAWNFNYWKRRGVFGPTPHCYVGTFPKMALFDKTTNYVKETMEIYQLIKKQIGNYNKAHELIFGLLQEIFSKTSIYWSISISNSETVDFGSGISITYLYEILQKLRQSFSE